MKVAVTLWEQRIAPVFDASHTLLIAQIKHHKIIHEWREAFAPDQTAVMAQTLHNLGVEVMICGAICQGHASLIQAEGIRLIPFIRGEADQVIEAYAAGTRLPNCFLMPGCDPEGF